MMSRIHRRVRHSDQIPSALKGMTFDRKTFVECSQRMRRIVPTLGRSRTNQDQGAGTIGVGGSGDASINMLNDSGSSHRPPLPSGAPAVSIEVQDIDLGMASDEDDDLAGGVTAKGAEDLRLPRIRSATNVTVQDPGFNSFLATTTSSGEGMKMGAKAKPAGTATLPADLRIIHGKTEKRQSSSSVRRMLLKPFTHFASLMSTIGDNLEIAAYH